MTDPDGRVSWWVPVSAFAATFALCLAVWWLLR